MSFVDGGRFGVFCVDGGGRRFAWRSLQLHQQTPCKIPHEKCSPQSKIHQVPERDLDYGFVLNKTTQNWRIDLLR